MNTINAKHYECVQRADAKHWVVMDAREALNLSEGLSMRYLREKFGRESSVSYDSTTYATIEEAAEACKPGQKPVSWAWAYGLLLLDDASDDATATIQFQSSPARRAAALRRVGRKTLANEIEPK